MKDEIVEMPYQLGRSVAYRAKAFSCPQLIDGHAFAAGLERKERDLACAPLSCVDRHALLSATKN